MLKLHRKQAGGGQPGKARREAGELIARTELPHNLQGTSIAQKGTAYNSSCGDRSW